MYQKVSRQKKGDYYMQKKKVFKTPHLLQYFLFLIHFRSFMLNLSFHCYQQESAVCTGNIVAEKNPSLLPSTPASPPPPIKTYLSLINC